MISQRKEIFWNSPIRLYLETALDVAIASMIKLYVIEFSSWYEVVSSLIAILHIVIMPLITILTPIFLTCRKNKLRRASF